MHKHVLLICLLIGVAACGEQRDASEAQPQAGDVGASASQTEELVSVARPANSDARVLVNESSPTTPGFRLTARIVDEQGAPLEGAVWELKSFSKYEFRTSRIWIEHSRGVTAANGCIETLMPLRFCRLSVRHTDRVSAKVRARVEPQAQAVDLGDVVLGIGGTVVATLPVELDANAAHGWAVLARSKRGTVPVVAAVDPATRSARIEGLPAGQSRLSLQFGDETETTLSVRHSVKVQSGQSVEVQLKMPTAERMFHGQFVQVHKTWQKLDPSTEIDRGYSHALFNDTKKPYDTDPFYRLFARGMLLQECVDLRDLDVDDGVSGPFVLELVHDAFEPWTSEPFPRWSCLNAKLTGYCALRFEVRSAAAGAKLNSITLCIARLTERYCSNEYALSGDQILRGLPPESFFIKVEAPGHARRSLTIPRLENHEERLVEIELDAAMSVVGEVRIGGEPVAAAPLLLESLSDERWTRADAVLTNTQGQFSFDVHSRGTYRVHVESTVLFFSPEFEIDPGERVDVGTLVPEPVAELVVEFGSAREADVLYGKLFAVHDGHVLETAAVTVREPIKLENLRPGSVELRYTDGWSTAGPLETYSTLLATVELVAGETKQLSFPEPPGIGHLHLKFHAVDEACGSWSMELRDDTEVAHSRSRRRIGTPGQNRTWTLAVVGGPWTLVIEDEFERWRYVHPDPIFGLPGETVELDLTQQILYLRRGCRSNGGFTPSSNQCIRQVFEDGTTTVGGPLGLTLAVGRYELLESWNETTKVGVGSGRYFRVEPGQYELILEEPEPAPEND